MIHETEDMLYRKARRKRVVYTHIRLSNHPLRLLRLQVSQAYFLQISRNLVQDTGEEKKKKIKGLVQSALKFSLWQNDMIYS